MAMAKTIIEVLEALEGKPSGVLALGWRWGNKVSMRSIMPIPQAKPMRGGRIERSPRDFESSRLGTSSEKKAAATMMPPAKPRSVFSMVGGIFFFKKKTTVPPRTVPKKGMAREMAM